MQRFKPWLPVIILNAVSGLAMWFTVSLLEEMHELIGQDTFRVDALLIEIVRRHTPRSLEPLLILMTELLLWQRLGPVIAGLLFVLLVTLLCRKLWCEAAGFLIALITPTISVAIAKLVFQRARPDVAWAFMQHQEFSFPSGHASASVVIYGMAAYLVWRLFRHPGVAVLAWAAAFLSMAATGLSRVYLGAHYPTDVVAGYGVGLIWLMTGIVTTETLSWSCRRDKQIGDAEASPVEDSSDGRPNSVSEQEVPQHVRI